LSPGHRVACGGPEWLTARHQGCRRDGRQVAADRLVGGNPCSVTGDPRVVPRAPVPSEASGRPGVMPQAGISVPERVDPRVLT
jgi:hypothetical protein